MAVATLITVVGLADSSAKAVAADFDALRATRRSVLYDASTPVDYLDPDRRERLIRLTGVRSAGLQAAADSGDLLIESASFSARRTRGSLIAMQAGTFDALGLRLLSWRVFDEGHDQRQEAVAVMGAVLARELLPQDIAAGGTGARIALAGRELTVVGIFDSSDPVLATSVAVRTGWRAVQPALALEPTRLRSQIGGRTRDLVLGLVVLAAMFCASSSPRER